MYREAPQLVRILEKARQADGSVEKAVTSLFQDWLQTREAVGGDAGAVLEKWAQATDVTPDDAAYYRSIAPTWASIHDRDSIDLSLVLRHLVDGKTITLEFVKGQLKQLDIARSEMRKSVRNEAAKKRK